MPPNYSSLNHAFEAPLKVHKVFLQESFCQRPNKAQFCPFWLIFFTASQKSGLNLFTLLNMAITTPGRWKQIHKTSYPTFFIHRLQTPWMVSSVVLVSARPFRSKHHIWPRWYKMSLGSHWSTSWLQLHNNLYKKIYSVSKCAFKAVYKSELESDMKWVTITLFLN